MTHVEAPAQSIVTPDQRLRVFISASGLGLAVERDAAVDAVRTLRLSPVVSELGARTHPAREVYRSYIAHSDVFIGVYGHSYGTVQPGMEVSDLEDEYLASEGRPRLIYVKDVADREPGLQALIERISTGGGVSYRRFSAAHELRDLIAEDLAVLLTERFTGRADASELATAVPVPALPTTATSFLDRVDERERIARLLSDPTVRLVTICGPGGVGKTRLALEAGHAAAEEFPDGAVVLWLDGLKDPALVLQAIGAELRVKERRGRTLMETLADHLRGQRMLIILDNFEHLVAAAPAIADLVSLPTASKVLVTSREVLHVRGERIVFIDALSVPQDGPVDVSVLHQSDAVELFVDRARAALPGFELNDGNAADVAAIVRRLEGLPLAVELAAARVRILPPRALLQRLSRTLDLPAVGGPDLPARQRTLRDTIDWSFQLLEPLEQRAFARMSIFPAGATIEAAAAVLDDLDCDTLELLDSLLRKSLLRRIEPRSDEPRLTMLAAVREFAAEQLEAGGEEAAARDLQAAWMLQFAAETAERVHSHEQPRRLAAFDQEVENLHVVLEWLSSRQRTTEALTLANHLRWYWTLRGHLTAGDGWMRRLLELPGPDDAVRGAALTTAAMLAMELGDIARARSLFTSAVDIMTAAGDQDGLAWARTGLGAVLAMDGDRRAADELQEAALATFRRDDDLIGQCTANTRIALLTLGDGDIPGAEQRFNASLAVRRKIGDHWGTSFVLIELGLVRLLDDDYDRAQVYLEEALELVREIGYREGIARALTGLGRIAAAHGRWQDADAAFVEAIRLYDAVGSKAGRAHARALSARAQVEYASAAAAAAEAAAAFTEGLRSGDVRVLPAALDALACAVAAGGDAGAAAELMGAAEGLRDRYRVPVSARHPTGPGTFRATVEAALGASEASSRMRRGRKLDDEQIAEAVAAAAASVGAA